MSLIELLVKKKTSPAFEINLSHSVVVDLRLQSRL